MKFLIEIDCGAFTNDVRAEVANLLRDTTLFVERRDDLQGSLYDRNAAPGLPARFIGNWRFVEDGA